MKILMVTNQYPDTKTSIVNHAVFDQVQGLRKLRINVDVYKIKSRQKGIIAYLIALVHLTKLWSLKKYDLMHVQFGGLQAVICTIIARKKTVITFHGTDLHGGVPSNLLQKIKHFFIVLCSKIASQIAGGVIVVSPSLIEFLPIRVRKKAVVIPTGVDYDVFFPIDKIAARAKLNLNINSKYILFSDISGSPVKRRDIAIAVEDRVKKYIPEVSLLIVNQKPRELMPYYLNSADCLLLTSDKEGSPNIIKEALAVNLPIISVDVGDVATRCAGVENCQIVKRDINELSEAVIRSILSDRTNGGRDIKRSEIDNSIICRKIVEYYKSIIG